ncbi:unnamed protein product [Ambrosiozyma monospora]|uniref:Unnamed protein product n=1 Tax=Ambrosiozyma monospora TaxID=43982 RepID=A0ACB5UC36_AMBMO|nr:unnamed protein product [Ambrosiozyma monospora]
MLNAFKRCYSTAQIAPQLVKTKTLSNGTRLIVDETPSYFSAIGMYVDAGSRYESRYDLTGCSHIMDKMAFKSTESFSNSEMLKKLNHLGGNFMCSSSRETMIYQASVFNNDTETMFKLLSETVAKPKLAQEELDDVLNNTSYELNEIWLQSDLILPELFQQVAYNHTNLGNPLLCPADELGNITREKLLKQKN